MKIVISIFFLISLSSFYCVEFDNLNGSDLMLGIGARQIALGGAGSLLNNSPGSVFWNAASLAKINNFQMQVDLESPGAFNNLFLALNTKILKIANQNITLGFSIVNRLRFKGNSNSEWSGYATHLLDLTMIDVENFTGKIDSQSYDYRLAFAVKATGKLDLGITFVRLV